MREGSIERSHVTGLVLDERRQRLHGAGRLPQQQLRHRRRAGHARRRRGRRSSREDAVDADVDDRPHARRHYNSVGVLVDGATTRLLAGASRRRSRASGIHNVAILTERPDRRPQLVPELQRLQPPRRRPVIVGNCQASGGSAPIPPPLPLTTGPLFGQDGVRVTAGAIGSDDRRHSVVEPRARRRMRPSEACSRRRRTTTRTRSATTRRTTRTCASARRPARGRSCDRSISRSNITDNAFGVLNTMLDGMSPNTATPVWRRTTGGACAPARSRCRRPARRSGPTS